MTSTLPQASEQNPIVACTVSRDVQNFDLLIEDMETLLGENWGDLGFEEALVFLSQPDADALEFLAMAIDGEDEDNLDQINAVIAAAKARSVKVILIAEDVTPAALHQLLRGGADEFVPYPLPENELNAAVERLRQAANQAAAPGANYREGGAEDSGVALKQNTDGDGVLIAVQGLAGGSGATTLAVNLAWELANLSKDNPPRVCLIDLGLQFGSVATYLDLPRREAVLQVLSEVETLDQDSFGAALVNFENKLQVFTAPNDVLPLDMLAPQDIDRILSVARAHFDYVVVDMPNTLVQWSEVVLQSAQVYFATMELDMRSAQNVLRLKRALQSEELPFEKIRFLLNRAPKFTDLQGKSRVKRMSESLGIALDVQLPDGGRVVTQACDHGLPLASQASKNPLRKEIAKLAESLHAIGARDSKAA